MKKILILLTIIYFSHVSINAQDSVLLNGFRNPDKEFRPRAYWDWLNGAVSKSGLTFDMEEAKAKGLGGLLMWDTEAMKNPGGFIPEGPPFLGDESVENIHHAMNEASRLDLDLALAPASGWNCGGSWVTPEMAGKNLFYSSILIKGPSQVKEKLPFPEIPTSCPKGKDGLPRWYMDVAVLAWPDSKDQYIHNLSDIVNLSGNFKNGELLWSPPAGDWHVARFVCTNNGQQLIAASPNSHGFFIDFLDPEATRFHFTYIINKLGLSKRLTPGTPLKSLDDDSMELFPGIQWTTKFQEWFQNNPGYDPIPWLPVFLGWTIGDKSMSERFSYDYKKAVSDLLIFSHYKTGSEVCREYGLELVAEAGGPGPPFWDTCPVDALKALGNVGIPRGEFWLGNPRNLFLVKEISSAAHIYGKPYVDAESWTSWRRWRDGLFKRKLLVDRAFCEGLNRITYHSFAYSPQEAGYPGQGYHAGIDMNPQVVWWSKAKPFMDYLARCSYMLQQGKFVADVAYYYGDQTPNFWPFYHNVPQKPGINGLDAGYDYDVVNTDVILNGMSVIDGKLHMPDGMSYRILVLPDQKIMTLEVLLKLEKLVSGGAIIMGPKPLDVPGLQDFKTRTIALRTLAAKMWGDCNGTTVKINNYGKGKIVWGYTPRQWLARESVGPDFLSQSVENADSLDYIHRHSENFDIYFVRNKTLRQICSDCLFRIKNKTPQIWDPSDGSKKELFVFKSVDGGTLLPLVLPPGGSVFVVFVNNPASGLVASLMQTSKKFNADYPVEQVVRMTDKTLSAQFWHNGQYVLTDSKRKNVNLKVDELPSPIIIDTNWTVNFDPKWGGPEEIKMAKLISWTDYPDKGVKYYSGSGFYNKTIEVPADWLSPGRSVYLDLGDVRELAEVFINGHSAGVLWKPPFRTEITSFLKPGKNLMKIEVINLWINRLTGDQELPDDRKFTRTNIRSDGSTGMVKAEPWHVEPSGILGPVRLLPSVQITVKTKN